MIYVILENYHIDRCRERRYVGSNDTFTILEATHRELHRLLSTMPVPTSVFH